MTFACENISDCMSQRDNYEAIFNSLHEGLAIIGPDETVTMCNQAFVTITGLGREEAVGKTMAGLFCENKTCGLNQAVVQTIERGRPVTDEPMDIVRRDGTKVPAVFSTSILRNKQGEPTGIVVVFRDESRVEELQKKLGEREHFYQLIGSNRRMQELYALIEDVAVTDASVLILGESGTGKELVANAIHRHSRRSSGPFVKVSCAALSETILESELFGHVKGAFTGAYRDKPGRFEQAHGGTLFLDEIGELGPAVQVKLLRVLQEREIERVGDIVSREIDVRLITATNKDLKQRVHDRQFRDDLYYRLKVVALEIPPLRERREDIPLLAGHFINRFNRKYGKNVTALHPASLHMLMEYEWDGNVRELENAVEHAFVKVRSRQLMPADFPPELRRVYAALGQPQAGTRELDPEALRAALQQAGGNKAQAAQALGIHRATLWRNLKKHGLDRAD
jgi:two-component system, NtrC family, response regulator HydG